MESWVTRDSAGGQVEAAMDWGGGEPAQGSVRTLLEGS